MQILYARTHDEIRAAGALFQESVEPLLVKLEAASKRGHRIGRTQLGQDYLQVCRWPFRQLEYSFVLAAIEDWGKTSGKALEAGSGITPFGHVLASRGFEVRACDYDRQLMSDLASANMHTVYGCPVTYEWQDLTALGYPDASFDLITCVSVLEHIPAPLDQTAMRELVRVLRPGGLLVLTVDFEPAARIAQVGGRYRRRLVELVRKGDFIEIFRSGVRKLQGRRQVLGGHARHSRTANQPFGLSHLEEDLLPILQPGLRDPAAHAIPANSLHAEDVEPFWNLVPGLFEVQGRRLVLPAALAYVKP